MLRFRHAVTSLVLAAVCGGAVANDKPVTLVVPFPAGSTSDLIPRLVSPLLSKALNVPVVVENRPGANGSLGAARVATSPKDGTTLLLGTTGVFSINQWIYDKLSYNPEKDFDPVINAAATPNMIVVSPSTGIKSLRELVSQAKARPNELSYASAGNGSTSHLCGELLMKAAGIQLVHVPYQGPAPAMQDILAGRVTMICDNLSNVLQHVKGGKLTPIAVTAGSRASVLPDVPTASEAGVSGVDAGIWYGFAAPAGTPPETVKTFNVEIAKALNEPSVKKRLNELGLTVVADSPEEFKAFMNAESRRMQELVKVSGAKIK